MHTGRALKIVMVERQLNNDAIAKVCGTTTQQVSRWRSMADMKMGTAKRICDAADFDFIEFCKIAEGFR